jgi:hypothetical protein
MLLDDAANIRWQVADDGGDEFGGGQDHNGMYAQVFRVRRAT